MRRAEIPPAAIAILGPAPARKPIFLLIGPPLARAD
jgi:hypothetical protein